VLSDKIVEATLKAELPGAIEWAKRHGISVMSLLPDARVLRVVLVQETTQEEYFLQGCFDQYKELPPVWEWRDKSWAERSNTSLSPERRDTPFGPSMFLPHGNQAIICAPFNRMAFDSHGGPHKDWGEPAQWRTPRDPWVHAVTIGDMLQAILRDFRYTRTRMG